MVVSSTRYNNGMSNVNTNSCNCEPTCTTCGRPWVVCKGDCGCKKSCCNNVNFCEYGEKVPGCLRSVEPGCPYQAVIPSVVVDNISGLKNLADCFVHVTSINTTFYIDDKHRIMTTWAGPVEYDNYDLTANSLGLRSQFLIDFANDRGAYYDKTGKYQEFNFGNGGGRSTPRHFVPAYGEAEYRTYSVGPIIREAGDGVTRVETWELPISGFTDQETEDSYTLAETFELLENGEDIVFDEVPVGYYDLDGNETSYCDGVTLSVHAFNERPNGPQESFAGATFVSCPSLYASATMGIALVKEYKSDSSVNRYVFTSQGFTRVGLPA